MGVTDTAQRASSGPSGSHDNRRVRSQIGGENVLASETDLPSAAVSEIASILAHGYLRYRASLRRAQLAPDSIGPPQPAVLETTLASQPTQSVHVTVVNARSTGET